MSITLQLPSIAFFGATGGVTNSTLVHALRAYVSCIALVRTPKKLRDQLLSQGVSQEMLDTHLSIVQGDALDKSAVKKTLSANNVPGHLVSQIVTGLGGAPSLVLNWRNPLQAATLDNPHICAEAAQTLLSALKEIYEESPRFRENKPDLTFVSTTGISRGPEDVPFAMQFLYHQLLALPHKDKKEMEGLFRQNVAGRDEREVLLKSVTGIRPTLLTGGVNADDAAGLEKVRAGTEKKPAVGYTIKRADVGHWIWANVVESGEKSKRWRGEMVSLTS